MEQFLERLQLGVVTTIFSMAIVFIVLIALMGVIILQAKVFKKIEASKEKKSEEAKRNNKPQISEVVKNEPKTEVKQVEVIEDDGEIVAAIICAIEQFSGLSQSEFTVKSIKRINDNTSSWRRASIN